jgi:hypothetical protein
VPDLAISTYLSLAVWALSLRSRPLGRGRDDRSRALVDTDNLYVPLVSLALTSKDLRADDAVDRPRLSYYA